MHPVPTLVRTRAVAAGLRALLAWREGGRLRGAVGGCAHAKGGAKHQEGRQHIAVQQPASTCGAK